MDDLVVYSILRRTLLELLDGPKLTPQLGQKKVDDIKQYLFKRGCTPQQWELAKERWRSEFNYNRDLYNQMKNNYNK